MRFFFIITFFLLFFSTGSKAQDQHFTQFYVSPILVNAAFTGSVNGTYRIAGIYRNQWFTNLNRPDRAFTTFTGSFDTRFDFKQNKALKGDAIGAGVYFYHSSAGISEFQDNSFVLSGAFHKVLDPRKKQFLSLGIQVGVIQRSLNFNDLNFEDEFNGIDGFDIASIEDLPANSITVEDINIGLLYTFAPSNNSNYFIGGNINHITSPIINFFDVGGENVNLQQRFGIQAGGEFPFFFERSKILPRLLINSQGESFETLVGSNVSFRLKGYNDNKISIGTSGRIVNDVQDPIILEAVSILGGFQTGGLKIGASYDLAVSDLFRDPILTTRNAFEISLSYTANLEGDGIVCPDF